MPSTLRTAAAVVLLISLLGLCTLPANAQPRGAQGTGQAETNVLKEARHWLAELWSPAGMLEQLKKVLTQESVDANLSGAGLNRGGVYDPNGHP